MKSLKDAIVGKINPYDREYMNLVQYSTVKAVFELDSDKWINDCLRNVSPNNRLDKFEQVFSFSKQVPKMIMFSNSRFAFEKFVIRKFKSYIDKNRKQRR